MNQQLAQSKRNTLNLIVDSVVFCVFLVTMAPRFSGIAIHEWLGIAFGGTILTHVLLHWQWIVEVTRRLFGKVQWSARVNYLLNLLLFIDLTVVITSGLLISEVALPLLGITVAPGGIWRTLHTTSANLFLILAGLHVALHWQWIVNMVKKMLTPRAAHRAPQLSAVTSPLHAATSQPKQEA